VGAKHGYKCVNWPEAKPLRKISKLTDPRPPGGLDSRTRELGAKLAIAQSGLPSSPGTMTIFPNPTSLKKAKGQITCWSWQLTAWGTRREPVLSAVQRMTIYIHTKVNLQRNPGRLRMESWVLRSWTMSPEHPQPTAERERGEWTNSKATPVQKNYTIYIYIYIQYINLFLLNPNNIPPPK
jgi:hypothetical protein